MQQKKLLVLGFLITVLSLLVFWGEGRNVQPQIAPIVPEIKIMAQDLFYYDSLGNAMRLTTDGGSNVEYYSPVIGDDEKVYVVRCTKQGCTVDTVTMDGVINTVYQLDEASKFVSREFYWSLDRSYIVVLTETELIKFDWNQESVLKTWETTDIGVGGGSYCNTVVFSAESEYFAFCKTSASLLSIQGDIFIFDRNGNELLRLAPDISKEGSGLMSPRFEGRTLHYLDDSTQMEKEIKL